MVKGKVNKEARPSIYPFFFGSSINKGTYQATVQKFFKRHSMKAEGIMVL
jgi:menaquinone-dependent protoporphyrinogen IX oxidase